MRHLLSFLLFLGGCAQGPAWKKNAATERAHEKVMAELSSKDRRVLASDFTANLADLSKVKPGKFEVYVFPKISEQNHKFAKGVDVYLGKPRAFEVSIIAENPCKQFIKGNLFASLKPATVFPAVLAEGNRRCAILEVTDKSLRTADRARLKRNDVLLTRLFLDDEYQAHGIDRVLYETASQDRTVRALSENGRVSSGLSLFPVDLPPASAMFTESYPTQEFNQLDGIAVHQIRKRHNRAFAPTSCRGGVMNYKDDYGSHVKLGWCSGLPWPTYIDNARFFSVTQPLSVGGVR